MEKHNTHSMVRPVVNVLFNQHVLGRTNGGVITSDGYEAERKRMKAKTQSEQGKKEHRKRGETVEWPFGDIKQNLGLREFLTRGLLNVKTEYNLVCTAHNLKMTTT
jgi:hypothetical protein